MILYRLLLHIEQFWKSPTQLRHLDEHSKELINLKIYTLTHYLTNYFIITIKTNTVWIYKLPLEYNIAACAIQSADITFLTRELTAFIFFHNNCFDYFSMFNLKVIQSTLIYKDNQNLSITYLVNRYIKCN